MQARNAVGIDAAKIASQQNIRGKLRVRFRHAEVLEHSDCEAS
jgi:hypothetical protein